MRKWYKKGNKLKREILDFETWNGEIVIWYLGQCGFAIKAYGVLLLVDPVLCDICENEKSIRMYEPPFSLEDFSVDYIFCTHKHIDHLNKDTVVNLLLKNKNTKIIAPQDCCEELQKWGVAGNQIIESKNKMSIDLKMKESYLERDCDNHKSITVLPFSLSHPDIRFTNDGGDYCVGYNINVNGFHIVHFGDTYICDELLEEIKDMKRPDVIMISINGKDFYREKKGIIGNTTFREAIQTAINMEADTIIPMHFDMIKGNTESPVFFLSELISLNATLKFRLPMLGEHMIFRNEVSK